MDLVSAAFRAESECPSIERTGSIFVWFVRKDCHEPEFEKCPTRTSGPVKVSSCLGKEVRSGHRVRRPQAVSPGKSKVTCCGTKAASSSRSYLGFFFF